MTGNDVAQRGVYRILLSRVPDATLAPDLPLGSDGIGLDSIALAEVLLECEDAFGVKLAAEMLGTQNVTVGRLIEYVRTVLELA